MRSRRCGSPTGSGDDRASVPRSCTPTRPTTSRGVDRRCGRAASSRASLGAASSRASGWDGIGGWWSGRSRGSIASAASKCATNDAQTSTRGSSRSAVRSSAGERWVRREGAAMATAEGRSGLAVRGPADPPAVIQKEVEQPNIGNHEGSRPPQVVLGRLRLAPGTHGSRIG
jgi:hypothetical protein